MKEIYLINRKNGEREKEPPSPSVLKFIYKQGFFSKILLFFFCKNKISSFVFGGISKLFFTKKYINKFIKNNDVNIEECKKTIKEFKSFNDFFIRELKKEARPINKDKDIAVLPADARYMVFPDINEFNDFYIKGQKFDLEKFLNNDALANTYSKGSMVVARLHVSDCHRFYFPFDCVAKKTKLINGFLYSVNPIVWEKGLNVFVENKRMITELESNVFGRVLYIEIGATNVGSVKQTFVANSGCKKVEEKGFFSLGGSTIVLLFEKEKIIFDEDFLQASRQKIEMRAQIGQSLGRAFSPGR